MKSGNLNFLEPSGSFQACNETALPFNLYCLCVINCSYKLGHVILLKGQLFHNYGSNILHSYHITAHSPLLKPAAFQCSVPANAISLFHHLDPKRKYYISTVAQKEE